MRGMKLLALLNTIAFGIALFVIEAYTDGNFARAAGAMLSYGLGAFALAIAYHFRFYPGDWVRDVRSGSFYHFRYKIGETAYVTTAPQRATIPMEYLELVEPIEISERRDRALLADDGESAI